MYAGSKGARVAGRAGAFGAKADDISAVEYNPAGLSKIGKTTIQLTNRFSYNYRSYWREPTADGGAGGPTVHFDEVKNEVPWQALEPMLGISSNFGLEDWAFALAAYSPPGVSHARYPVGTQDPPAGDMTGAYKSEGGQRYMMVELNTLMMTYAASVSYKFKKIFGLGASLQWLAVPKLSYSLVVAPVGFGTGGENVRSRFDMLAEVNAKDLFTMNAVVGAWVRPLPFLELAASGQVVPSSIEAQGDLSITQLNNGEPVPTYRPTQDNPMQPASDVSLTIPLPMWARLAARYFKEDEEGNLAWDLELDFVYQTWSRVKSFDVTTNGLVADHSAATVEIGDITIDKQWRDSWQVQLGSDVSVIPKKLTVRAGASYESPVAWKKLYTHIDFPTGDHITGALGASVFFGGLELAASYAYRFQLPVNVKESEGKVYQEVPDSPCMPPYTDTRLCPYPGQKSATVNGGNYRSYSHFLTVDALYRF